MRKAGILLICLILWGSVGKMLYGSPEHVWSPGGNLAVIIDRNNERELRMTVTKDGEEVISSSQLGLVVNGTDLGRNVRISKPDSEQIIDESYPLYGNHSMARNHCREVSIPVQSGKIEFHLIVRAYDDGMAVRYQIMADVLAGPLRIGKENTSWQIPPEAECFWAPYSNSYEKEYGRTSFSDMPENETVVIPFTAKVNGRYLCISEADCRDFPDMTVQRKGACLESTFTAAPEGWEVITESILSPWRLVIVADQLTDLVNSDLIMNLCMAPAAEDNFDWVKPGRVLWQWWSIGDPLLEDQENWYDAAARLGWEYYLVDAGWSKWKKEGKDKWDCMKEIIAYGETVGVETLIWVHSKEMPDRESLASYLDKVVEVGAAGVKIDFIPRPKAEIVRWYTIALEETSKRKLLCNFHGCVKPTGLRRTWPHELTREAVRGHEYHISRYERVLPHNQDVIQPFTRQIAGPADFTPVAFVEEELLERTWAREIASALVYMSPLTHFADHYKYYLNHPAEDLLRDIPVTWDETRVLPGSEIGHVAAFARRKGNEWWIGVVTGEEEVHLELPMDFLDERFMAVTISDRPERNDAFIREQEFFEPEDVVEVSIRPGGGYFMRLLPACAIKKKVEYIPDLEKL